MKNDFLNEYEDEEFSRPNAPGFWNPMTNSSTIRPANQMDADDLSILVSAGFYVHRHLDWRSPTHWLTRQPFFVLEENGFIQAALACPPDPPDTAWIRLYATNSPFDSRQSWNTLFPAALEALGDTNPPVLAALSLHEWFSSLLLHSRFQHNHNIIVLEWERRPINIRPLQAPFQLLTLQNADLEAVTSIDHQSFDKLWQISNEELANAYQQSAYSSIIKHQDRTVAYQISTRTGNHAHLARLAVLPEYQRQGLASALLEDLLAEFTRKRVRSISVNTQHTNHSSIALYEKAGFIQTGESFPVFLYQG
jgi:ribosomal-protein-alanine N-acetyltransferase